MPITPQQFEQIVQAVTSRLAGGGGTSKKSRRQIKRIERELSDLETLVNSLDTTSETIVQASTIGPVSLAADLEAGDSLDGYTLQEGDLVLVPFQNDPTENGIYQVASSGAPPRAPDWDSTEDFIASRSVSIENGSYFGGYEFKNHTHGEPTFGVDPIHFVEVVDNGQHLMRILDDFDNFTNLSIYWSAGGGGTFATSGAAGAPGILEMTPASGGGVNRAEVFGGQSIIIGDAVPKFRLEMRVRSHPAWDGTDNGITIMGLANRAFANPPDDGVYFTQSDALGPDWHVAAAVGGVRTENPTGIAMGAADFELFTIDVAPGASSIRYFHNRQEVTGSPISTNIPDSVLISRFLECSYLAGPAARTLRVDRYDLRAYVDRTV